MNQSHRILTILSLLLDSKKICTKLLALQFNENERNIQRDIKLLKEFFGNSFIKCERGCYKILNNCSILNITKTKKEAKELKQFFEFLAIIDSKGVDFLDTEEFTFLKQIKRDVNEIYTIFDNPVEELKTTKFLDDIKTAIKYRRYSNIVYNEKEPRELKDIKPQKIMYAKNNWYLIAMTQNYKINGCFKRFRINFIENFKLKSKTFHRDILVEKYIKNTQSLFQDFNKSNYEVLIKVDFKIARYFLVKKHLKSQTIIKEHDNGDLTISYMINNDMEIMPFIKTWLPNIKVISPDNLKQKLIYDIKTFLDDI